MTTPLRIGNGCGFWGDNRDAPVLLAQHGNLDVLTLEYLAELTMSILALQKQRDPDAGYASDFLDALRRVAELFRPFPQAMPTVVTNAGGMNPRGCARRARDVLREAGVPRTLAIMHGDDLLPNLDRLLAEGHAFTNLDTGANLATVRERVVSANAYLGARPIAEALSRGANVVITGRVADASLTVGPAMHAHGWAWDDWDRLASATTAGHLIECGAQLTGGLWCNGDDLDLAPVGYPIASIAADGSFDVDIPRDAAHPTRFTGGVNRETFAEQLLYEVGDPARYLTPDVVADFTSVRPEPHGHGLRVPGAHGLPATDSYKVSIAYRDGFQASGTLVLAGPHAVAKAYYCGEIIRQRLARVGVRPERFHVEAIGDGACAPGVLRGPEPVEVVLRVAVADASRAVVERFTRELAPLVTSGPPGVTGYTTGRPTVREVFAYWPTLIDKHAVTPIVEVLP